MNIAKHPIYKAIYELCLEIEKLPASEQQTKVVIMASSLEKPADKILSEYNTLLASHERLRVALEALVDSADATADYENTGAMDVGIKKACDALLAIPAEFRGGETK